MNDRELLELAAKAVGYDYKPKNGAIVVGGIPANWNPLTDDGDALRLAVKLELQLRLRHSENAVSVYGSPDGRVDEADRADPCAATRRAIVRAAAEIGKVANE